MITARTRVLQISDTHLFASPADKLMGINTSATLDAVLERIRQEHSDFQCLLVTGDLTQDGSTASYQHLKTRLDGINAPYFWLCGNHDEPDIMEAVNPSAMAQRVDLGDWQIILLNTRVPGAVFGYLRSTELKQLDQHLRQYPDKHTLVALHHHPTPISSLWMDKIRLRNTDELCQVLERHSNIRGLIHGHVHQERLYRLGRLPVMATPSTCVQFAPEADEFQASYNAPGFRLLDLWSDGRIDSQVIRLESYPMDLDLTSNGY